MDASHFIGIDPSSSYTGIAVLDGDGTLVYSRLYSAARKNLGDDLAEFKVQMTAILSAWPAKVVCVEKVSVSWNLDTVRKIAYFEAIAMMVAAEAGAEVMQMNVSRARKRALGSGKMKKPEVVAAIKEMVGDDTLSEDECEAVVLALAARVS